MRKIRFLCDVDGVIADFTGLYMNATEQALGYRFRREDLKEWDIGKAMHLSQDEKNKVHGILDMPGMGKHLQPYPNAVAGAKKIMGMVDEFYFVTSPLSSNPTWVMDRDEWIDKYFGKGQSKKIIYTHDKYPICGSFLLDDKPQHISEWKKEWPNGVGIIWDQPYNDTGDAKQGVRVYNWSQVELLVKGMRNYTKPVIEEVV